MLKVAIVGCGKIADAHALQLQRIKGCEIVGVCDREPLMAQQLYDRFPVKKCFTDLSKLLSEGRPDVVHITTPRRDTLASQNSAWNGVATSTWKSRSRSTRARPGN